MTTLGVIGGSGLYEIDGLDNLVEKRVDTPYGPPSDALIIGNLGETRLVFLPRHGRGHRFAPHEINYRANIYALKAEGVTQLLGISAVGSLQEEVHPGEFVVVDQFIDRTKSRAATFFEDGAVAHIAFGDPLCGRLATHALGSAEETGVKVHQGGTYVCMEGPAFSTRAESELYRSWGARVIGMTNLTEAKLAREAEICFATVALVTDYDCWHAEESDVDVEAVLAILHKNADHAKTVIAKVAGRIADGAAQAAAAACSCQRALEVALMTQSDQIPPEARERLRPLLEKYL